MGNIARTVKLNDRNAELAATSAWLDSRYTKVSASITKLRPKLSGTAGAVIDVMLTMADAKSGECRPSVELMAYHLSINEKSARRAIAQLQDAGLIRVKRGQRGNTYTILALAPAHPERTDVSYGEGDSERTDLDSPADTFGFPSGQHMSAGYAERIALNGKLENEEVNEATGSPHAHGQEPEHFLPISSFLDSAHIQTGEGKQDRQEETGNGRKDDGRNGPPFPPDNQFDTGETEVEPGWVDDAPESDEADPGDFGTGWDDGDESAPPKLPTMCWGLAACRTLGPCDAAPNCIRVNMPTHHNRKSTAKGIAP